MTKRPLDPHELAELTYVWARSGPQQILMVWMKMDTTVVEVAAWL